jgi:hypothetical protein
MMDNKQKHFTLAYRNECRSIPIKALPSYNEVITYAKNLFPGLELPFKVGYTDDENDFVFARSDMELSEAYRLFKGSNEIKLTIHESTDQPLSTSGNNPDQTNTSSYQPTTPTLIDSDLITNDDNGLILDDSLLQLSLKNLNQIMTDLSKAKQTINILNENNRAKQIENEKLISAERDRYEKLELELRQAQDIYSSISLELTNLKESLPKVGTQLHLKLKEISELKKDREDKLRLKTQLDELDKQLNGKIDENLTMSKHIYTLTIERDHFNKKAKELEHRQRTMEAELTASQYSHMNLGTLPPMSNNNSSMPTNPVLNGGIPGSGVSHPSVPIYPNDHTNVKIPIAPPLPPQKPVYDLKNPPPDIDPEDIRMLLSMGFNENPDTLFQLIRKHGDISRVIEELLKKIK